MPLTRAEIVSLAKALRVSREGKGEGDRERVRVGRGLRDLDRSGGGEWRRVCHGGRGLNREGPGTGD